MNLLYVDKNLSWKLAWENKLFRKRVYIGLAVLILIFACLPFFFNYVQQRPGILFNDWILNAIPVRNVSPLIFICIWATFLLMIIRSFQQPSFFITMLYAYSLLCIFRFIAMFLVPLEAPQGLIPLIDPLSNLMYGKTFITKDLFFSGHTSIVFLMCLCFQKKADKYFSLITTILIGVLVLIQHVHYTIDVLAAPFFSFLAFIITKKWILSGANNLINQEY
jgi:hypothetical protein